MLDAGLMVQQAVHFDTVTPQRKCIQGGALHPTRFDDTINYILYVFSKPIAAAAVPFLSHYFTASPQEATIVHLIFTHTASALCVSVYISYDGYLESVY